MTSRREFLRRAGEAAGLSAAAAGGVISVREFLLRRERKFRKRWFSEGWLIDDPAVLEVYSRDFGNLVRERPLVVVFPESLADVVELVGYANEHGIPLICRGVGHACNGQSLLGGGIVIDFKPRLNRVRLSGPVAEMEPGITWLAAQQFAIQHGRGFPVLPDFLGITVGGNLALGGMGTRSLHFQSESDHLRELEVVTGDGKVLRCSRSRFSEIFRYTPFSLGQLCIITRIFMNTIPYRPRSRIANIHLTSFDAYSRLLHRLVTEYEELPYDFLYGFRPEEAFTYLVRVGKDETGDAKSLEEFSKWAAGLGDKVSFQTVNDYELYDHGWTEALPRTTPDFCHIWTDFLPPPGLFLEMSESIYEEISSNCRELNRFLALYQTGVDLEMASDFPLAAIPRRQGKRTMSCNLYFTIPPRQTRYVEKAKELIAGLIDRFVPRGCGLYMYGWFRLSSDHKRRLWPDALPGFFQVKKATDPLNLISPFGVINSMMP